MITIKDALKVNISLVLKLCDFETAAPVSDYSGVKVLSGDGLCRPVKKQGGVFVFTDRRPETVSIVSDKYENVLLDTAGHDGVVLRLSLIQRGVKEPCLQTEGGGEAHIGFSANGAGRYALSQPITKGDTQIRPQKDDLSDITDLYHAVVAAGGQAEAVYITKNLGNGQYALNEPVKCDYPLRGTRLIPLYRVAGGKAPVPRGASTACILSSSQLSIQALEGISWV